MDLTRSEVSSLNWTPIHQVHHFPAETSLAIRKRYHIFSPQKPPGTRDVKQREVGLSKVKGLTQGQPWQSHT